MGTIAEKLKGMDIPPLYQTENMEADQIKVCAKIQIPNTSCVWYIVEYDPNEGLAFGYAKVLEAELGYISIDEIESLALKFLFKDLTGDNINLKNIMELVR